MLANLKSDVDKSDIDIDKFKNASSSLSSLKNKLDKVDIGKLRATIGDLSELSNVVKNDVIKRTGSNELIKKS